ncbi:hypothetical protein D3C84_830260 [compost metagenome]
MSLKLRSCSQDASGRVGTSRWPCTTSIWLMSTPAILARNNLSESIVFWSLPKVADVAMKRTSFGSTLNAYITRRKSSAISAAWEPTYVCASSRMIQRSLPADCSRIGASSLRTSMYSSIVVLVTSKGGALSRKLVRSGTWPLDV